MVYTMEYYSAITRNEIVPFAEMWTDLETVIQSEVRKSKTNIIQYCPYVESGKMITDELICKAEIETKMQQQAYKYQRRKEGKDELGDWD